MTFQKLGLTISFGTFVLIALATAIRGISLVKEYQVATPNIRQRKVRAKVRNPS
jgi:UPF0716 family protein affecting phage T7 exclusion